MAIPDPNTTEWVPIWHPESAGAQGPPGPQGPTGPQGPPGASGLTTPHQTTHQVGGTDELVNNAWKDKDNNFTVGQHINTPFASVVLYDTTAPANTGKISLVSASSGFILQMLNDAENAAVIQLYLDRNGYLAGLNAIRIGGGAASDPKALDYYEEGSWTPTFLTDSQNGSGQVYTSQLGKYTRIGPVVHANFQVTISNVGTGFGGTLYISGLPFASNSLLNSAGYISFFDSLNGAAITINPLVFPGQGAMALYYKNSSSNGMAGVLGYTNIAANTSMQGAITYQV